MRIKHLPAAILTGCLLIGGLPGARGQGLGGGAVAPMAAHVDFKSIPEVRFVNIRVENLIDFLRDQDPNFKVVVMRDPTASAQGPLITINVKNVTAVDVLTMITDAYDTVKLGEPMQSQTGEPLFAVKILPSPRGPGSVDYVHVYNLFQIVDALAARSGGGPSANHAAMSDVMSLIKDALDQIPDDAVPTLQVHEATGTLIVRGTAQQHELVTQTIQSLMEADTPSPVGFGYRGGPVGYGGFIPPPVREPTTQPGPAK